MPIDKSWMKIRNRKSDEYEKGLKAFIEQAYNYLDTCRRVRCPCKKCLNMSFDWIGVVKSSHFM